MNDVILPAAHDLGELVEGSDVCPRRDLSLQMLDPVTTKSCGGSIVPDASFVGFTLPSGDFNIEYRWIKTAGQIDHVARCTPCDQSGDDLQNANLPVAQSRLQPIVS